jgi:hypothetical protein
MSTATLQNTKWQSCIDACMRCAEACEFCATSDLREQDVKMMASCTQINRECAEVCWASAALMSMDSQFAKQFAACALTSAMLVLRSVKGTILTIARDAHRCAETAPKNVEGWQEDSDEG